MGIPLLAGALSKPPKDWPVTFAVSDEVSSSGDTAVVFNSRLCSDVVSKSALEILLGGTDLVSVGGTNSKLLSDWLSASALGCDGL